MNLTLSAVLAFAPAVLTEAVGKGWIPEASMALLDDDDDEPPPLLPLEETPHGEIPHEKAEPLDWCMISEVGKGGGEGGAKFRGVALTAYETFTHLVHVSVPVSACLCACVPVCLRACVPACLRACVPASCVRARVCEYTPTSRPPTPPSHKVTAITLARETTASTLQRAVEIAAKPRESRALSPTCSFPM